MRARTALAAVGSKQAPEGLSVRAVEAVTGWLASRTSRRGFLVRAGVLGSALAIDPTGYLLKPATAYASVCGSGASCTSGWTVFCATINKGVNACPPGSIAAGWWKSDYAPLCGGKARYIVDCNATCGCTTSSGRAGICSPSCWSCRCTCGPAGQCDQRRVCCNAFRYGQCNTQVRQVGAVQCRVVSCTPPWRWAPCSTASATDNATRDHSSPQLPVAYTALSTHYIALGENGSVLGATVGTELATPGGKAQRYQHGRSSWTSGTGAHHTLAPITTRYLQLGGEAGGLGYPVADPVVVGTGRVSRFQRGRICSHSGSGTWEVTGAILTRYSRAGYETGQLGFPTSGPLVLAGGQGRASRFQHGRISWHPTLQARLLGAALAGRYAALGGEAGALGYPLSDETAIGSGVYATLQHGRLSWSLATGAHEVTGAILTRYSRAGYETGQLGFPTAGPLVLADGKGVASSFHRGRISWRPNYPARLLGAGLAARYLALGGEVGTFGYPMSDETPIGAGAYVELERGRFSWSPSIGSRWTRGPIRTRYLELGAEAGTLGFPTSDEFVTTTQHYRNNFERGWIDYDPKTGIVTDSTMGTPAPVTSGSASPTP